jgi:hypothetical protein
VDEKRQGPTGRRVSYRKVCNTVRHQQENRRQVATGPTFQTGKIWSAAARRSTFLIQPSVEAEFVSQWGLHQSASIVGDVSDASEMC